MKQVALRLDDDLAAAIDRVSGEVKRETWIKARLAEVVAAGTMREAIQSALQDLERGQMRYAIATLEAALGERNVVSEMSDVLDEMVDEVAARPATDRTSDFRRVTQPRVGRR